MKISHHMVMFSNCKIPFIFLESFKVLKIVIAGHTNVWVIGNVICIVIVPFFITVAISFITNVIVGDSLNYHNNMAFTTRDQDDDRWSGGNCATDWGSAGWFNICFKANPNGQYIDSEKTNDPKYLVWYHWKNSWVSLKSMKLMIRPRAWHQDLTGFFLWSPKLLFSYIRAEHELRFICETSSLH